MSKPTLSLRYESLMADYTTLGNLEHCQCCGVREFSNFQDNGSDGDDRFDAVWDWYDNLSPEQQSSYDLACTPNSYGGNDYPSFRRMEDKFNELFPEYNEADEDNAALALLCYALANTGKEWTPPTAITILALVENWDNAYPIMDALVEGGWQRSVETVLNTNSDNDISLWTYRRKEKA